MPTFTTIAWETLLEPRSKNGNPRNEEELEKAKIRAPRHVYISPALYVTPEPTPVPCSDSDPPSPSPYVVNHKGRRIRGHHVYGGAEERKVGDVEGGGEVVEDGEAAAVDGGGDDDVEFADPRGDAMSVASSVDYEKQSEVRSFLSNQGDFFDADEESFSDGSTPNSSYARKTEVELLATRLSLLDEIEKRKTAEFVVRQMYSQWQRLGNLLAQNGLTLPPPSDATSMQLDIDPLEQLSQELFVTRFVAEAIARGEARAEAELDFEGVIQSKDQEISRLRDRLRYYEAVNHEMSQRNQEVVEVNRRQRQKKKNQRKLLWSCLGVSVAIGASVIVYSYMPQWSKPLPSSYHSSDASRITSETSH